eukprot:TRINITY_DN71670_c0_g1_i1.p1 TRINITY_DN71670_c0_g1~~TRINITY_DN71670_c0_g1_i1.p1  ORF type:complete len:208 (+),score=32.37 TRINITY_DN71670_c0_g1_i1:52-675(+)
MSGGLYRVLGVSHSASKESIRVAYLRLAKKLHPDVNKAAGAEKEFQKVREAYEVLSDEKQRREYDRQHGSDAAGARGSSSGPQGTSSWAAYDKARRSTQSGAGGPETEAMWRARRQAQEDLRYRAYASQMNAGFNRGRYQQSMVESFLKFLPLLVPVWMIALLVSFHRRSRAVEQGHPAEMVTFDQTGRAYAKDAYGRLHRLPDFDR